MAMGGHSPKPQPEEGLECLLCSSCSSGGSPANVGMLGIVCSGREICGWAMLVLGAQYTSAPVQGSPFLIHPVLSASPQEPGCSPYQRLCKVLVTHILTKMSLGGGGVSKSLVTYTSSGRQVAQLAKKLGPVFSTTPATGPTAWDFSGIIFFLHRDLPYV